LFGFLLGLARTTSHLFLLLSLDSACEFLVPSPLSFLLLRQLPREARSVLFVGERHLGD
jgi:hypothetical protein